MTHPCTELRQDMVAFLTGELEPLAKARLESHLAHCAGCQSLRAELDRGLDAARHFEPELDAEHLRRLKARLSPYTESRVGEHSQLLAWGGISLVAVSLLLVVGVVIWGRHLQPVAPTPIVPIQVAKETAPLPVAPAPAVVARSEPTPFVRLLTGGGWDGTVQVEDRKLSVRLSKGFVVTSFNGGRGRSLRLTTPSAVVEAVGTRFLVEVSAGGATTVAVADGKVRVTAGRVTRAVVGGELLTLDANGRALQPVEPKGRPFLEDAFLLEHHGLVGASAPAKKTGELATLKEMWPVLEQIEQAEALANKGQLEAALTIYQSCSTDAVEAYAPYRQLCRLEMARLLGFKLGKSERARDILGRLVREEHGEVGRQASLAICELDLKANPCRAIACLATVVDATRSEPELRGEAERLLRRWREGAPACPAGGSR
jgi:hypothetical protein